MQRRTHSRANMMAQTPLRCVYLGSAADHAWEARRGFPPASTKGPRRGMRARGSPHRRSPWPAQRPAAPVSPPPPAATLASPGCSLLLAPRTALPCGRSSQRPLSSSSPRSPTTPRAMVARSGPGRPRPVGRSERLSNGHASSTRRTERARLPGAAPTSGHARVNRGEDRRFNVDGRMHRSAANGETEPIV
jgi:hypothetical protein